MMRKLGVQCQDAHGSVKDYNRLVKPRAILGINVVSREFWQQLRNDNPNCLLIYRHWPNWNWNTPQDAEKFVDHLVGVLAPIIDLIDVVQGNNEWIHAHMTADFSKADLWMEKFIVECHNKLKRLPMVLNAATGNWSDKDNDDGYNIVDAFPHMLAALENLGGYLGFHEYDWPQMWRIHSEDLAKGGEGMWHCLRWKRASRAIKQAGYEGIKFIISECGLDKGVVPGQPNLGWLEVSDNYEYCLENYVSSLKWYNDYLETDSDVEAALIFGCGMVSPWGSFDIKNSVIPERIAQFPNGGEPPVNGDNNMAIKVLDRDYNVKDLAWAEREYNIKFDRADVPQEQTAWRLVELWEKTGISCHNTQVWDRDGQPVDQQRVAWYWPGVDPFPFPTKHDWRPNFQVGLTNANGDVCPGMGTGAYYDPYADECGPHEVWIHDPSVPSDRLRCVGMRGMTNHDHLDCVFQLQNGDTTPPEPSPEPTSNLWTMTLERQVGIRLLIGKMPTAGIPITVTDPWGNGGDVISGDKPEYGIGGWEVVPWTKGKYTIKFLEEEFTVQINDNETVIATFTPQNATPLYDSDWVLTTKGDQVFQHNLGKVPALWSLLVAADDNGTKPTSSPTTYSVLWKWFGHQVRFLAPNTLTVRWAGQGIGRWGNTWYQRGIAYARLIIWTTV